MTAQIGLQQMVGNAVKTHQQTGPTFLDTYLNITIRLSLELTHSSSGLVLVSQLEESSSVVEMISKIHPYT